MLSIENWINNINSNKRLIENGRWLNITFTFGIGDKVYLSKFAPHKTTALILFLFF